MPARSSPGSGSSTQAPRRRPGLLDHARAAGARARADIARHPPPLVEVDHDLQTVAGRVADRGHGGDPVGEPLLGEPDLDGAKARPDERVRIRRALPGRSELAERGVGGDALAGAAEQGRDRDAERLPGEVPQCRLQWPVPAGMERDRLQRPRVLGEGERIAADEQMRELLKAGHRVAAGDTGQAIVGADAHKRGVEALPGGRIPGGVEGGESGRLRRSSSMEVMITSRCGTGR